MVKPASENGEALLNHQGHQEESLRFVRGHRRVSRAKNFVSLVSLVVKSSSLAPHAKPIEFHDLGPAFAGMSG